MRSAAANKRFDALSPRTPPASPLQLLKTAARTSGPAESSARQCQFPGTSSPRTDTPVQRQGSPSTVLGVAQNACNFGVQGSLQVSDYIGWEFDSKTTSPQAPRFMGELSLAHGRLG